MRSTRGVLIAATLVGAVCLGSNAAAQAGGEGETTERLRAAVARLDGGDALHAMLDLEGVLARDPDSWAAHYHLGRAQAQLGDDLGAKDSFVRAANLHPGLAQLHFMAAAMAYRLAHFEAAWSQAVSASQSGYPAAQVQQLMQALRRYSEPPDDLAARLAAPAVAVTAGGADAELEAISADVRAALYHEPRLAVTLDETQARYRLELVPERGRAGGVSARLVRIADGVTIGEAIVASGSEAVRLGALVDSVAAWVGAPTDAGIGR